MQITEIKDTLKALAQSLQLSTLIPSLLFVFVNFIYILPYHTNLKIEDEKVIVVSIFVTIFISYSLYAFNSPMIRLLEGYWGWDNLLMKSIKEDQIDKFKKKYKDLDQIRNDNENEIGDKANQKINNHYPENPEYILPTELGNVLAAFEYYSKSHYNIDSVTLWPRLIPFLRDNKYMEIVSEQKSSFDFMVNFFFIILFCGFELTIHFSYINNFNLLFITILSTSLLSFIIYKGAIAAAIKWGCTVKVAFDIFRKKLRKILNLTEPESFEKEKDCWGEISNFILTGRFIKNSPFIYPIDNKL